MGGHGSGARHVSPLATHRHRGALDRRDQKVARRRGGGVHPCGWRPVHWNLCAWRVRLGQRHGGREPAPRPRCAWAVWRGGLESVDGLDRIRGYGWETAEAVTADEYVERASICVGFFSCCYVTREMVETGKRVSVVGFACTGTVSYPGPLHVIGGPPSSNVSSADFSCFCLNKITDKNYLRQWR